MAGKLSEQTNMSGNASIDRAADFIEVTDSSGPTTYKATPNFILGITGNPVGTTDIQTLTQKTLTSPTLTTPTMTINDDSLSIRDNSDTTKVMQFQLSGITTGTTRTLTVPDASGTLVLTGATQTLTGKTLTAPTITNPTLTVDTISEFTAANGVSIDGLLIKDGLLPAGNVKPNQLQSGTGTSWGEQSYTPTFANTTLGNGSVSGAYNQIGKTVFFWAKFVLGSTSAVGSGPTVSLPVTSIALTALLPLGTSTYYDDSAVQTFNGSVLWATTTTASLRIFVNATNGRADAVAATNPITWTTSDIMLVQGSYTAA